MHAIPNTLTELTKLALACLLLGMLAVACGPTEQLAGDGGPDGECGATDFQCGSGECVPRAQTCNGTDNCLDGSDEDDCVDKCDGRAEYRCQDGTTCISTGDVCDGREDCPGGDDESTCGTKDCSGFECKDGTCISDRQKCDGKTDCADGEDESELNCAPKRCPNATDLRCKDGRTCVEEGKVCDGKPDCPGAEDEDETRCGQDTENGPPAGNDGKGGGTDADTQKPEGNGGMGDNPTAPTKPGGSNKDPGPNRECTSINEEGLCDGETLVWCDKGKLERRNCRREGKVCGRKDTENGFMCLSTENTPTIPTECGSITREGECQGTGTLLFCARGKVRSQNCARRNRECRVDSSDGKAKCMAPSVPEGPDGCGELTEKGRCAGDVVEFCDNGVPKSNDCSASGRVCGMVDEANGFGCIAKPCGGVTFAGECNGDTLSYCKDDSALVEIDCAGEFGMGCGFQSDEIGFNCLPKEGQSSCGEIDFQGQCNGTTVTWCGAVSNELQQLDCAVHNKECGFIDDEIGFGCVAPANACGDITFEGECQGDTVLWCSGGEVKTRDCSTDGKTCGEISPTIGNWCVESASSGQTCEGMCDVTGPIPGSTPACYCDPFCTVSGDCCGGTASYEAVCSAEPPPPEPTGPSCEGHCDQFTRAPGSTPEDPCYCDSFCTNNGDCCEGANGYAALCEAAEPTGPTCEGHCGETSAAPGSEADPCYCDSLCEITGDCCEGANGYTALCTGP